MSDRFETLQQKGLAVQQDPNDNDAWLELGNALGTDSIRVDGTVIDRTHCFTTCLNNDDYFWRAWYNLGVTMENNDSVIVRGHTHDRLACLTRCLELEDSPATAGAWNVLGAAIGPQGKATVGNTSVTPTECFVRALEHDPSIADAWHNLSLVAPGGATVSGAHVTSQQCLVNALERDPKLGRAWYSLAVQLYMERIDSGNRPTVQVSNESVDELTCVRRALINDPQLSHGWHLLGNTLRDGGGSCTTEIDGVKYNPESAVLKAIECDQRCALAWCNLAPCLGPDGAANVDGESVTAQTATLRSLQLLPRNPFAWYNLGVTVLQPNKPSRTDVAGRSFDANDCFVEALRCEPEYGPAWLALGHRLQGDETVTLNGVKYDRFACIAKGELFGGAYSDKADVPQQISTPAVTTAAPHATEEEL